MKVLVTGGAGFIGSHIAEAAVDAGHRVLVVDDLSTGRTENLPHEADFHPVDIRNREALLELALHFDPDAISHHAAQASVSVSMREPLLDWCRANISRLDEVHLGDGSHFLQEDHPHAIGEAVADWYLYLQAE